MQQVILAAGKGSRLKSTTTNKCLIELCGKKLIEYSLDLGVEIGVSKIIVIVGYNKDYIINYLGEVYKGIPVEYVIQEPQKGIAHGVMVASRYITEDFFMCLSDEIIVSSNVKGFKKFFESNEADCVCGVVQDCTENIKKTYTLKLSENNRITEIIEKPYMVFNNLKGTGYCMMSTDMLTCLEQLSINPIRNEYEMGDWIKLAIQNNCDCYSFEIAKAAYNINEQSDFDVAKEYIIEGGKQ